MECVGSMEQTYSRLASVITDGVRSGKEQKMSSLKCPECGWPSTGVLVTAENKTNTVVRRRRECPRCGYRFTTRELYALDARRGKRARTI